MYKFNMSNIHLTGHNGLVGTSIKNIINVTTYDKKIFDYSDYSDFIKNNNIQTIIHAAGKVGGVLANYEDKIKFYLHNSNLNNLVFSAAYENKVKKFINFSSTCVFPDNIDILTEEKIFDGAPHFTNDSYAYSKRMMQHLCNLAKKENLNYFTIIPTNVFGPNDNFNIHSGHALPALIHKCFLAKQNNTDFLVWGDGSAKREFIFSKDLAVITNILLNLEHDFDSIIVSPSIEYTIEECAIKIAKIFNFNGRIIFDKTQLNGQLKKTTDTSRFKKLLPNFKFTEFDDALNSTIEWFIKNYSTLRK